MYISSRKALAAQIRIWIADSELVSSGPLYDSFSDSNKACATLGSQPGNPLVDGNPLVSLSYGYSYSHLWRVGYSSAVLSR